MRLLLDEHLDKALAAALRGRGFDVIAVTEDERVTGSSDEQILAHALDERRAVVTYDAADFRVLADQLLMDEAHHFGMILLNRRRFRHGASHLGALLEALTELLERTPAEEGLIDREIWL